MRKLVFIAIILAIMGIALVNAAPYEAISPDQAKENVKGFFGNPDANVEFQKIVSINSGNYYVFDISNDSAYVNTRTGNVERVDFTDDNADKSVNVVLSKETALAIASEYVSKHYVDFDKKNMHLIDAQLVDHRFAKEYRFVWGLDLEGVETPDSVIVLINPYSGKIITYMGISREIEVSLKPEVTKETAVEKTISQFPAIVPIKTEAVLRIDYPEKDTQKLIWLVKVLGEPKENIMQGGVVAIDAQSGKILLVSPFA